MSPHEELDLTRVRTIPIASRPTKVHVDLFAPEPDPAAPIGSLERFLPDPAAVEKGIPLIQLNVHENNPARRFYRRLGFGHLRECLTYAIGGQAMLQLALPASDALVLPR